MRRLELLGQTFGRWSVIERGGKASNGKHRWVCKCECGNVSEVTGTDFKTGHSKSCGCLNIEILRDIHTTHGMRYSSEYDSWSDMKKRCDNPKAMNYHNYGGRGIKVCSRWLESFENFLEDMGPKPSPELTLDRWPNNETGNYEPGNCRWATDYEQFRNRRSNRWYEYGEKKMVLTDWASFFGVSHSTLIEHLKNKKFEDIYNFYSLKKIKKNNATGTSQ